MKIYFEKDFQNAFDDGYKARDAEIVHCKDCKWWNPPFCDKHFDAYIRKADWFCADGEVATVKDEDIKDSGDLKDGRMLRNVQTES